MKSEGMKFFDAFSGYGGFHLGIERAYDELSKSREQKPIRQGSVGDDIQRQRDIRNSNVRRRKSQSQERYRLLNGVCIGYSEIDKYASAVYKYHFGGGYGNNSDKQSAKIIENRQGRDGDTDETGADVLPTSRPTALHNGGARNYGDITKIDPTTIPDFDLLTGGVPCQSWSIAGKRGGFEDERGNMWFQFSRILRAKQPKYFIAENVKGLLSHDGGQSMERICEELCGCGYAIDFEVLNAKNFGVPQNRERVFIIGIRIDLLDKRQVF